MTKPITFQDPDRWLRRLRTTIGEEPETIPVSVTTVDASAWVGSLATAAAAAADSEGVVHVQDLLTQMDATPAAVAGVDFATLLQASSLRI